MLEWFGNNEEVLWWLAAASLLIFLASLVLIPWLIVRIPADYFVGREERRSMLAGCHPILVAALRLLRNIFGLLFFIVGVLLLVLPGQGLLTIFLGVVVADFPGKRRAVNWLVAHPSIHRPINWLRCRAGREAIKPPPLR